MTHQVGARGTVGAAFAGTIMIIAGSFNLVDLWIIHSLLVHRRVPIESY